MGYKRKNHACLGIKIHDHWVSNAFKHFSSLLRPQRVRLTILGDKSWWLFERKVKLKELIDFRFMDPLTSGDYPKSMRSLVGARLPKFTTKQARLLIGSFDFIGLNYYSSTYASDAPHLSNARPSYLTDSLVDAACKQPICYHSIICYMHWIWSLLTMVCPLCLCLIAVERNGKPIGIKVCIYPPELLTSLQI